MSADASATMKSATLIIHWLMSIAFAVLCVFALYKWAVRGETTPLWLLTFMAGMGGPAVADLAFPNHDARSMVVWSAAMLGGSLLLCAVEMHEPLMGWFGALFVVASFAAAVFPNAAAATTQEGR